MNKLVWLAVMSLLVSGCAHHRHGPRANLTTLLHDDAYPSAQTYPIESEQQIFTLPDEAKVFLDRLIASGKLDRQNPRAIADVIFSTKRLNLLYSNDANTTAGQTFANRQANCLSMTILAFAMAEYVGLRAQFQQVMIPEYWVQRQGISMLNGHVNLILAPGDEKPNTLMFVHDRVEVDFNGGSGVDHFPRRAISKARVVAMFYNNKGADAMLAGDNAKAYRYFRAALNRDSQFISAMGNIGALYRQTGHPNWAQHVYDSALEWQPGNLTIMESVAILKQSEGKQEQAEKIYAMLERRRESNPYYHFMLGEQAYYHEHWRQAIYHYQHAVQLKSQDHQFYFGLAKAYYQMNDLAMTQRYLRLAKRHAPQDQLQRRYQGKLDLLSGI